MNLTVPDIIKAHGPRILNVYDNVHDTLAQMDLTRHIKDEDILLDSVNADKQVTIDIVVNDDPTIGDVLGEVAELLERAEGDLKAINAGRIYSTEEWFLLIAWKLELLERGETDEITIGARPLAMRMLAMLQAERMKQDIPDDQTIFVPTPRWAEGIRAIKDEAYLAQAFLDEFVPAITELEALDAEKSRNFEFNAEEAIKGHPRNVTVEFAPGQVIAVMTIVLGWDDFRGNAGVAIIDDHSIEIDAVFPESKLIAAIGQPLETLFDHEITRGLGFIIDKARCDGEGSTIEFKPTAARTLKVRDVPTNWWHDTKAQV